MTNMDRKKKYPRMTWVFCLGNMKGHGDPRKMSRCRRQQAHLQPCGVAGMQETSKKCPVASHYVGSHRLLPKSL